MHTEPSPLPASADHADSRGSYRRTPPAVLDTAQKVAHALSADAQARTAQVACHAIAAGFRDV
ncbi:hypothetical protein ACF08N_36595 [Streptomyces sp. NPDC015127]|uniref:hypothetical protein n=1 Tax=Streptomyces sp. NPDC015127 TaxID=3364939 RepID=UPI0036F91847